MGHNKQNQNKKAIKIALGIFLCSFVFFLWKTNFFYINAQSNNAPTNLSQEIQNRGITPIIENSNQEEAKKLESSNPIFDFFKNIQQRIEKQIQKPVDLEIRDNLPNTIDIQDIINKYKTNEYKEIEQKESKQEEVVDTQDDNEIPEIIDKIESNISQTETASGSELQDAKTTSKIENASNKLSNYISQKYFENDLENSCGNQNNVIILEEGGHNLLPEYLSGDTFYILYGENYSFDYMLKITEDCSKILGKSGFTKLYTSNHEGATIKVISAKNTIIENIILEGEDDGFGGVHEKNNYGIYLASTGNFISNTQSYNQKRFAIYMEQPDNFTNLNSFFKNIIQKESDYNIEEITNGHIDDLSQTSDISTKTTNTTGGIKNLGKETNVVTTETIPKFKQIQEFSATNKPTKIKKDTKELESELIRNLFEKVEDKFVGKNSLDLSESKGKIPIPIVLESVDEQIKVEIPEGTIFKTTDEKDYTGIILAPQKTEKIGFKSPGSKVQSNISFKVGSPDQEVLLKNKDGEKEIAQIEMEIEGYDIGDYVPFYSSSDGEDREFLDYFEVIEKDGKSVVNLETPHFSWISAGNYILNYFKGPITVSENNMSHSRDQEYSINNGFWTYASCTSSTCSANVNLNSNFNIQFRFRLEGIIVDPGGPIGPGDFDAGGIYHYKNIDHYIYDGTPPPRPTMVSEPTGTAGTSNTVSSNLITDAGVGGEQYQFCRNTTNSTTNCTTSARSMSNSTTFSSLTNGQIYYYFVRARDALGNTSSRSPSTYSTQDNSAPIGGSFTINGGATHTKATSVTLNITCPSDPRTPVQVAYGNSSSPTNRTSCKSSIIHTLTSTNGSKTVYIRFRDGGGNTTSNVSKPIILDTTSPTLSANNSSSSRKTSNISITLSVSDTYLNVAKYRWNNSDCRNGTNFTNGTIITQSTEGNHTLYLCARDLANNTTIRSGSYKLDKTKPTVSASPAGGLFSGNISITLYGADTGSLLSYSKYSWTSAANCLSNGISYTNESIITKTSEGIQTLYLCVGDNAGNINTANYTFTKDTIAPTITINNPNISPAQSKTISASTNEGTLTMSEGTSTTCNSTRTFSTYVSKTYSTEADNGRYVCYRAIDTAGNTSYKLSSKIDGIDTTPPTTTDNTNNTRRNTDFTVTLTPNEPSTTKYCIGVNNCNPTTIGTATNITCAANTTCPSQYVRYYSTDTAGNQEIIKTSAQIRIDKQAPTGGSFNISGLSNNSTLYTSNSTLLLNITCPNDAGVGGVQVAYGDSVNPENRQNCTSSKTLTISQVDGVKPIYTRFKDALNNTTSNIVDNIFLDTTGPSTPNIISPTNGENFDNGNIQLERSIANDTGIGLDKYNYKISTNSDFSNIILSEFTEDTGITIDLEPGVYYWAISAIDFLGNQGDRSETNNFEYIFDTEGPSKANIFAPSENQQLFIGKNQIQRSESIDDKSGLSGYILQISTDNFNSIKKSIFTIYNDYVEDFETTGNYQLRVISIDNVGNTTTGDSISINIQDDIIEYYFGSGSIFTRNRETNNCDTSNISIVYVYNYSGYGFFPYINLSSNRIYILQEGVHIANQTINFNGNCIALIGEQPFEKNLNTEIYSSVKLTNSIENFQNNNIIIDNLYINGTLKGNGGQHASNNNGINFNQSLSNSIHNTTIVGFGTYAISYNGNKYGSIYNINTYNNGYGLNIQSSNNNYLEGVNSINNTNGLRLTTKATHNLINNSKFINNSNIGLNIADSAYNTISNSLIGNNNLGVYVNGGTTHIFNSSIIQNNRGLETNLNGHVVSFNSNIIENVEKDISINQRSSTFKYYGYLRTNIIENNILSVGGTELSSIGYSSGHILYEKEQSSNNRFNIKDLSGIWNYSRDNFSYGHNQNLVPLDGIYSFGYNIQTKKTPTTYQGTKLGLTTFNILNSIESEFIASKTKKIQLSTYIEPIITTGATQRFLTIIGNNFNFSITGDILEENGGFLIDSIQTQLDLTDNKDKNRITTQVRTDSSNGFTHQESIAIIDTTAPSKSENIFIKEITITTGVKIERTPSIDSGAGISGYIFELSNLNNFSNIVHSGEEADYTTLIEGLQDTEKYFFRVKAIDKVQYESEWSNTFSFIITEEIENLVTDYYFGENNDFTDHWDDQCNTSKIQRIKVPNYNDLGQNTFPYSKLEKNTIYLLEEGIHILSEEIEFDGECIVLAGEGSKQGDFGKVKLYTSNTLTDMIKTKHNKGTIDNLIINGELDEFGSTHAYNGNGISFAGVKNGGVFNSRISNISSSHIDIATNSSNIKISNLNIHNNGSNIYGIRIQGSNNNILENINIFNQTYRAISLLTSSYNILNNINLFNNNNVISNGIYGISLSSSSYNTINNSNIQNNGNFGIWVAGDYNIINNSTINNNEQYGIVIIGQNNILNDIFAINNVGADILTKDNNTKIYGNIITKKTNKDSFLIGGNELESIGFSEGNITILANNLRSWDFQQNVLNLDTNKYLSPWTIMHRGRNPSRPVTGSIEFSIGQHMPTQVPIIYYSGNELLTDNIGKISRFYPNNFIASNIEKQNIFIDIDKEYSNSSDKNRKISIQCSEATDYYITGDITQDYHGNCIGQQTIDLTLNGSSEGEKNIIIQTRTDPKQKNHKHIYTYLDDSVPSAPLLGNMAWVSEDKKEIEFFWNKSYDNGSKVIGYYYELSESPTFENIIYSGFIEYNTLNVKNNDTISHIYIRVKSIDISGKESEWLVFGDNIDSIISENNLTINKYLSPQNYYTSQRNEYDCLNTGDTRIYILKTHPIESEYVFDFDHLMENSIYILEDGNYIIDESISFDKKCVVFAGKEENNTQILSNNKLPTVISLIHTKNNIIENLQINGEYTSTGSTHAKTQVGMYLIGSNINSIYSTELFGLGYGVRFYSSSRRNILNYITCYRNNYCMHLYGGGAYNTINNAIAFNNNEGFHSRGGKFNTFNNILSVNNNVGLGFSSSSKRNVINNSILANNKNYGITSESTVDYNILSNIRLLNNGIMDIETINNQRHYNYIAGNTIANSVVTGGNEFSDLGRSPGYRENIDKTQIIDNSVNIIGNRYLRLRSKVLQGQNTARRKTNNPLIMSFGNDVIKQSQPVIWSGSELIHYGKDGELRNSEYFIGSKTKATIINTEIDKFITEGSDLTRTIDLFLSGNGELNYIISGEILQTISGSFSGSQSIPITISAETDGLKNIIVQVRSGNENPTHYQTVTFIDSEPPTTPLPIQPLQHHTGYANFVFANIDFERSESVDYGIGMSGYVLEISDQNDFSNIIYKHTLYDTTQTVALKAGSYFWRVTAFDKALKYSPYSAVRPFYVETNYIHEYDAPSIPTILHPDNNEIFNESEIDVYWSQSVDTGIGLSGYIYEISKDLLFQNIVFSGNTANTGIHINDLAESDYFIRVFAIDYLDNISSASEHIKFTIDKTDPNVIFTGETLENNAKISSNEVSIRADIIEENLESISRNRNGFQSSLYDSGLILMMNFDNVSAIGENNSIVKDLSIYGSHGNVSGAIWTEDGKYGGAYEFNGIDSYIELEEPFKEHITISLWFKIDSNLNERVLLANETYSNILDTLTLSQGAIVYNVNYQEYTAKTINDSFNDNQRHNLILDTENKKLYVDGKLQDMTGSSMQRVAGKPTIGARYYQGVYSQNFSGLIDELRIYNRALSTGEIEQLYKTNLNKISDNQWNFTSTQTCLPDGNYFYELIAKDKYYNTTKSRNFTVNLPAPTIGTPSQGLNISGISASILEQTKEFDFTGVDNTFRVYDTKGYTGWYTTISLSGDLTNQDSTQSIDKENVFFKAQNKILTLEGVESDSILISEGISTYKAMTGVITYMFKELNDECNSCIVGKYANNPSIKLNIPAFQKADTYHGTMIFTLYD